MVSVQDIAEYLGLDSGTVRGSLTRILTTVGPIVEAVGPHVLTFCDRQGESASDLISCTAAGAVICDAHVPLPPDSSEVTFIPVVDPRLSFVRVFRKWFAPPDPSPGIHPTSVVSQAAEVHPTAHVGPMCYVGAATIGPGTVLHGHVHLGDGSRVGARVLIQAGAVIGMDGFGYQPTETDAWEKWPHIGGVVIGDDVEIGANVCIDRGCLSDTVIEEGVKIGNMSHIAHNVRVGRHAAIVNHVTISGSARIGARTWVASHACVANWVSVGSNVTVGMCALVRADVPEGVTVAGVPARVLPHSYGFARPTSIASASDSVPGNPDEGGSH